MLKKTFLRFDEKNSLMEEKYIRFCAMKVLTYVMYEWYLCSTLLLPNFVVNGRAIDRGLSALLQTLIDQTGMFLGLFSGLGGLFRGNLSIDFILNVVDLFD